MFCFVRYTTNPFIFWGIISIIIFLILVFTFLLLVYKNTFDFCILTLLTSLNISRLFFSFGSPCIFLCRESCHMQIGTFLLTPYWSVSFIPFSCLISLARTSSNMLNKSAQSWHPCLISDLRGKAFSLMLAVGFSFLSSQGSSPLFLSFFFFLFYFCFTGSRVLSY